MMSVCWFFFRLSICLLRIFNIIFIVPLMIVRLLIIVWLKRSYTTCHSRQWYAYYGLGDDESSRSSRWRNSKNKVSEENGRSWKEGRDGKEKKARIVNEKSTPIRLHRALLPFNSVPCRRRLIEINIQSRCNYLFWMSRCWSMWEEEEGDECWRWREMKRQVDDGQRSMETRRQLCSAAGCWERRKMRKAINATINSL